VALIRKEIMKKIIALLVSVVLITFGIFNSPVVANSVETNSDESNTEIVSDQTSETESNETLEPEPDVTPIVDVSVPKEVTDSPDLGQGYAVVGADGVVSNIIVCSYNVCGSNNNWLELAISNGAIQPGSRLVLQTTRNQETGNVAGYIGSTYNPETNSFTISKCSQMLHTCCAEGTPVYQIPFAYPGSQELTCVSNCIVVVEEENSESVENNEIINNNENIVSEENFSMMFSTNLKPNTFANIVAKNKNKTKIWKVKVNKKGIIKINVGKKYKKWRFEVKVGS
jgi:hypothetical protein